MQQNADIRSIRNEPTGATVSSINGDNHIPEHEAQGADLNDLLDVVIRQRRIIGSIVIASLIAAFVWVSIATPRYTASGELIIDTNRPPLSGLDVVLPGISGDNPAIISETAVLKSGILLNQVVDRLDLTVVPEFNTALQPPGVLGRMRAAIGMSGAPQIGGQALTVETLSNQIDVGHVPNSRVIRLSVTSEDPDRAQEITNTLLSEYLLSQQLAKSSANDETQAWLSQRIFTLQRELLQSEQKVEAFRSEADLLQARGDTLISQQLSDLNSQLIVARTATATADARLSQLSGLMSTSDNRGIYTANEVLQSPLIQNLRQQQVGVERRIAELSSEFGPAHPTMIQLNADADDLRVQISLEVDKIVQALRNEVTIAQAREDALAEQVNELTSQLSLTNEDEIQLRALEREAEANRGLLESLLARQKELGAPGELMNFQSDARVISYANRPVEPSHPAKAFTLGIVFILSSLAGLVVAFVREFRNRGIVDLNQLESVSGLTSLGFIPYITSQKQRRNMLSDMITSPASPFAQALKATIWQLGELGPNPCKTVLITSSTINEGKTMTAIGIARSNAINGKKTLLIDADIRSPSVHEQLGIQADQGLREILEDGVPATDQISFDSSSSLDVLPAGKASGDPLNWLDSSRMKYLISHMECIYDCIVIDSPPIVVAPDACVLSKLTDTSVILVRWSHTPRDLLKHALQMMRTNGGHITGTLLTMLNMSDQKKYGYGYYGTYGSHAKSA